MSWLWSDFMKDDLFSVLNNYPSRKRRFGGR
jgi:undecaprenyl pyrophosphate synthase